LPVVTIERVPGRPDHRWYVRADNEESSRVLLDHLAEAGAERIAMLRFEADMAWVRESEAAYLEWCQEHGREPIIVPTSVESLENSAYRTACRLLGGPDPPDAFFASAERFASGVLRAAHERGLRVPDDLLVATGIDSHDAREAVPPVTAVDIQAALQGICGRAGNGFGAEQAPVGAHGGRYVRHVPRRADIQGDTQARQRRCGGVQAASLPADDEVRAMDGDAFRVRLQAVAHARQRARLRRPVAGRYGGHDMAAGARDPGELRRVRGQRDGAARRPWQAHEPPLVVDHCDRGFRQIGAGMRWRGGRTSGQA